MVYFGIVSAFHNFLTVGMSVCVLIFVCVSVCLCV